MDQYYIVHAITIQNLQDAVNAKIAEGYAPLGGPAIARQDRDGQDKYLQAMIIDQNA